MTTTTGGTQRGNERMNDNPRDNRKIKSKPADVDRATAGQDIDVDPRQKAPRAGAMKDKPSGAKRGDRRHAAEGGNVDRKKGS